MPPDLDLIRRIYAATAGEASWQAFADGLSAALDHAGVVFSLQSRGESGLRHRFVTGIDAEPAGRRVDAMLDIAARSAESRRCFRTGFASAAVASGAPNLLFFTAVDDDDRPIAAISALRAPGEADFGSDERSLVGRLTPHLDRAVRMSREFLGLAQQSTALAEVMQRLPAGILLLDQAAKVVFKNRSAQRILGRCDGIELVDGVLRAEDPHGDETLQALIEEVVDVGAAADAGGILVAQRPSGASAYPVSVSRLLPGRSVGDVVACVLVSDPDRGPGPAIELMRSLHGLTRAESELVGQLVRGSTLEEAARARGVSINTARSHLKHVFGKTRTSRQGELVQLVLRSFVPMAEE